MRQGLLAWVRARPRVEQAQLAEWPPASDAIPLAVADQDVVRAFAELILNRRPEGPS